MEFFGTRQAQCKGLLVTLLLVCSCTYPSHLNSSRLGVVKFTERILFGFLMRHKLKWHTKIHCPPALTFD